MRPIQILRLEGLVVFLAALSAYAMLGGSWWLFVLLFLTPDAFMVGYVWGPRVGAWVYNVGHTYLWPVLVGGFAVWTGPPILLGAVALIWTAHIGLDRALGYGLKNPTAFQDTHVTLSQ